MYLGSVYDFLMFVIEVSYAHLHLFDQNTWNIITVSNTSFKFQHNLISTKYHLFLWWQMSFSIIFQSSVSSQIILLCWFAAQETFIIIISVENSYWLIVLWKLFLINF